MKKALANDNWAVTANRFVAYFDIMGFKDMVLRTSHDKIYAMMKSIDERIKSNSKVRWTKGTGIKWIQTTTYSDSIIIYSKDDSFNSLYVLICTVAALTNDLLAAAIPHKGAVAYGMMTLDTENSIFFGQPLIDAYVLQEELSFYGIIVHSTAEQEIEKKRQGEVIPFLFNYLCHLKNGNAFHLTIGPIYVVAGNKNQAERDRVFASCKELRFKTSGHLRKYIDNTELYLNFLKQS